MVRIGRAGSNATSLRFAENLVLPTVQVIVISADMSCKHCHGRVAKTLSKMNTKLLEYAVDIGRKEVVLRGVVGAAKEHEVWPLPSSRTGKRSMGGFWDKLGLACFGGERH